MVYDAAEHNATKPPELEHDPRWRDAGYWLALQARFVAARPLVGGGSLLLLLGGVVMEHSMVVNMLVATGKLTDALVKHRGVTVQAAVANLAISAALFLVGTVVAWYGRYAYQFLWRAHLTHRLLRGWFADDRYYRLERAGAIDNPEQRIQEDLYFVGFWTVWLIPFFVGAVTSGVYAWVLIWRMSYPLSLAPIGLPLTVPFGLATACLLTAFARAAAAHFAGAGITRYEIIRKRLDAEFRHHLTDVREQGEAVAFQGGGPREERRALQAFAGIGANWWRLTRAQMALSGANSITSSLSRVIPAIICIQPIMAGRMTIGKLVVAASTFTLAMQLIGVFADEYQIIAWLRASVARIRLLEDALATRIGTGPELTRGGDALRAEELSITLPNGGPLLAAPTLELSRGGRISVAGRSGSGKSTLLRSLAGLWPHAAGRIAAPAHERMLFLPQRPFLPHDNLAAALSYPDAPDRFAPATQAEALRRVGLPQFASRLNERAHWRKVLSPGEQQRLSAARALLRQPDFLIVDEPTSGLDPDSQREVYKALDTGLPNAGILTVAHSRDLGGLQGERYEIRDGVLVRSPSEHSMTSGDPVDLASQDTDRP